MKTFAQEKLKRIINQAEEILRWPFVLSLADKDGATVTTTECAQRIQSLQNLTDITKVNAGQKNTLNALESLLAELHQELQQSPSPTTDKVQNILAQPRFAPLLKLVGDLTLSPFTMSGCG